MSISPVRAFFVSAALLLTAAGCAGAQSLPAQARPVEAAPQLTPFERNPFIFSSPQEAIRALDSADMLLRRSGVEWLGRWTCTYTTYGIAPDKAACAQLQSYVGLVPSLTRAVREMPKDDSRQAARLLVLLGPSAKPAIPAVCAALTSSDYEDKGSQYGGDVQGRVDLLNSLTQLCGGPDGLALALLRLMRDKKPETRRAAAATVGFCDDPTYRHISLPPQGAFHKQIMPALAVCVDDPVTAVRLAALTSLEKLTYDSTDAPWHATEPALARAVASTNPDVRLAALKVLAYMPGDVSSLTSSLRGRLHDGEEEQKYALAALCHAAGTNRALVATIFLAGLSSPNVTERHQSAADVRLMVMPLWNNGFFPDKEPLPWFSDDRLFARYGTPSLTPQQQNEEQKQRQAAQEQVQQRLLAALIHACFDPDPAVRADAAASLDIIGQWAEAAAAHGFLFAPKVKTDLTVKQSLIQAAAALQQTDPDRAKSFQDMSTRLWERQGFNF